MEKQTDISRRSFLKGSMSFAAGLALANIEGDIFSATPAHAADGAETNIIVVRPTEIGIVAYDLTYAENPVAVPECHVSITSRYNGKTVEGTTNADGKIVFDIEALAEEDPDSDYYAFNGSIKVRKDGYREVNIPLARIIGHSAFVAPTRPLDNLPYFRSLTFNGWDVQYTAPEFLTSKNNTENHNIEGELWLPSSEAITEANLVKLDGGTERTIGSFNVSQQSGKETLTFELAVEFLNSGKDTCLGEGTDPRVAFGSEHIIYETYLNLDAKPAVVEEEQKKSEVVVPATINHNYKAFTFPDTFIKPFAGSEFTLWQPTCPFVCQISPAGFLIMGFGTSTINAKSDTGKLKPEGDWKVSPTQSFSEQLSKEIAAEFKALENYKKQIAVPNDPKKTQKLTHKLMSKFSCDVTLQAFASLTYNRKDEFWRGSLSGVFSIAFNALWTVQCTCMFVPLFLQVGFTAALNVSIYLGVKADSIQNLSELESTPERTLGFGLNFGISVGLGIGIAGFVSASVTGSGYISCFYNYLPNPDVASPRIIAGFGGKVYVTLQFMLFKYTFTLTSEDKPQFFDSAKYPNTASDNANATIDNLTDEMRTKLGLNSNSSSLIVGSGDMPSYAELAKNAVIVTNKEMLYSREFKLATAVSDDDGISVTIEFVSLSTAEGSEGDFDFDDESANYYIAVTPTDPNFDGTPESVDFDNIALPTYEYVGSMTADTALASTSVDIEGISSSNMGGVKPTYDELLFENITSNPKLKILTTVYGKTVMFRIATVELGNGQARTRLVYHIFRGGKWSAPNVVEFNSGFGDVNRDDMYDFDFDVAQGDAYDGANYIFLNVTSGTRPDGDATTFNDGVKARYCTLVCLYDSNFDDNPLRNFPNMTCGLVSAKDSTFISPAISVFSDTTSVVGTKDFCVMASMLGKSAKGGSISDTGASRRVYFARWEKDTDSGNKVFRVDRSGPDNVYTGVSLLFPTVIDDEHYERQYLSCAMNRRVTAANVRGGYVQIFKYEGLYSDNVPWKKYFIGVNNTRLARTSSSDPRVDKIWKFGTSQGFLLGSCKATDAGGEDTSAIYKIEFDPKNEGSVSFTQIGSVEGAVSDFVSDPDGHYLFFAENIDGKTGQDYVLDDNGEPTGEVKDTISHKYYIKAMANIDGLFTKPFVFAELEHAADSLVATCADSEYISFMVDDITDMSKSISNLYDVRVPFVKCLTPVSLTLIDPFCFSGEPADFSLEVRNDGNLVATGATFNFINAETGELVESKTLKFSEVETLEEETEASCGFDVASLSGSGLENNILLQNNGNNVLLPGTTRPVKITFNIPETWGNEKRVRVEITNIQYLTPSSLNKDSVADEHFNVSNYHISEDDNPHATISISNSADADTSNLTNGEVRIRKSDDAKKATIPKTGDSTRTSVALATMGVAVAGFVAYSNRRSAIEGGKFNVGKHCKKPE